MENRKIIDYDIITKRYEIDLVNAVKALILDGWQPLGGMSIDAAYYSGQAMVKYEKEKEIVIKNSMRIIDDDGLIVETDKVII